MHSGFRRNDTFDSLRTVIQFPELGNLPRKLTPITGLSRNFSILITEL